jgi:predicted RNA-binding protein with PUA domain
MRDGARRVFELFLPSMEIELSNIDAFLEDVLPDSILSHSFSIDDYESVIVGKSFGQNSRKI